MNAAGLALLKRHEGLRLAAYRCPAGVWTIGYGHTGDVEPHHRITSHEADAILEVDVDRFERGVLALTRGLALGENELAALTCFAFNVGLGALGRSRLLACLMAGDKTGAAEQFGRWAYAGGKRLPGLERRRAEERALFLTPDAGSARGLA